MLLYHSWPLECFIARPCSPELSLLFAKKKKRILLIHLGMQQAISPKTIIRVISGSVWNLSLSAQKSRMCIWELQMIDCIMCLSGPFFKDELLGIYWVPFEKSHLMCYHLQLIRREDTNLFNVIKSSSCHTIILL